MLFLCITPIIYIFLSHQAKFKKQNQIASKKLDDTSSSLKSNKISNQTLTIINTDLSDGYQDTEKHNDLLLQNKKIQSLEQLIEQQKVVHEEVIHEQKKALEELIKSTEIQYQPQIKDMQVNIDKLAGHITFLKERARVFDVNFDDDTFSNILKGRQFEVFVASVFVKKYGYKVIEWSPDKGFNAGIFSESNLHSDLLIQDKHGCLFAVECKYRGDYYFYNPQ